MLCNANPRKQKKQNQRTIVTKGKAMKHKDQEGQDRLGTQNHINYLTKCLKLTFIKRFGENVGSLAFSRNILKTHNLSFNKIPESSKTCINTIERLDLQITT